MVQRWYRTALIYSVDVGLFQDTDADGVGDLSGADQATRLPVPAGRDHALAQPDPSITAPGRRLRHHRPLRGPSTVRQLRGLREVAHEANERGIRHELREALSWRRGDTALLAEANVADDELLEYFGHAEGSATRVTMVFVFRLNQMLMLALARQDADPIRRIMHELPALPRYGQWVTFLRNHDEVDLGRLSPEERQDVFDAFGPEPNMQLYHRGIRCRLAPILNCNRRRIEMASSLQFTMPGTPAIRYGTRSAWARTSICPNARRSAPPCSGTTPATPASRVRTPIGSGHHEVIDAGPSNVLVHRATGDHGVMLFLHNLADRPARSTSASSPTSRAGRSTSPRRRRRRRRRPPGAAARRLRLSLDPAARPALTYDRRRRRPSLGRSSRPLRLTSPSERSGSVEITRAAVEGSSARGRNRTGVVAKLTAASSRSPPPSRSQASTSVPASRERCAPICRTGVRLRSSPRRRTSVSIERGSPAWRSTHSRSASATSGSQGPQLLLAQPRERAVEVGCLGEPRRLRRIHGRRPGIGGQARRPGAAMPALRAGAPCGWPTAGCSAGASVARPAVRPRRSSTGRGARGNRRAAPGRRSGGRRCRAARPAP